MKTIWKFPLLVSDVNVLEMPKDATILSVQAQDDEPMLWALIEPEGPKTSRVVLTFGTGHRVDDSPLRFIGTYQLRGGAFVGHVFEPLMERT
jgi:hypothetical protein